MGSGFGATPKTTGSRRRTLQQSIALAGAVTVLVAALLAPLLGAFIDFSVKGQSVVTSFTLRELTNLVAALAAVAALFLVTRIRGLRLNAASTLVLLAAITVATFAVTRFVLQVSVRVLDLAESPQWVGPEVLWAILLWPILFTVLALVAQRERIVDAQLVLIDEARRALSDDHEALRSRVFDHLHGTVTSELVVARVRLNDLAAEVDDPAVAAEVSSVASGIQRLHELEVRRLAHVMVASGLETSLDEALQQLAASCEGLCTVKVSIAPEFGVIDGSLATDARATLRLTLYRIVEECLSNAMQHAHAQNIEVTIDARSDGTLDLIVANDGQVSPDVGRPGVGLAVIKARISAYDGDLQTVAHDHRFVVSIRLRLHV